MAYENRHWIIVNTDDVTDEMINNALQINSATLRKTLDGSKALLKWDGDTPSCFDGITTYNHSEILTILNSSDWKEEE
tara:strand:+ start:1739 stop:1972 length:234 start_codon:yes stop_codon:yes gene_type:complete